MLQDEIHEAYMKLLVLEINRKVTSTAVPLDALYADFSRGTLMTAMLAWHNDAPSEDNYRIVRKIDFLVSDIRDEYMTKLLFWCSQAREIDYVPTEEELNNVVSLMDQVDSNIMKIKRLFDEVVSDKPDLEGNIGKMNNLIQMIQSRNGTAINALDHHMANAFGDPETFMASQKVDQ